MKSFSVLGGQNYKEESNHIAKSSEEILSAAHIGNTKQNKKKVTEGLALK